MLAFVKSGFGTERAQSGGSINHPTVVGRILFLSMDVTVGHQRFDGTGTPMPVTWGPRSVPLVLSIRTLGTGHSLESADDDDVPFKQDPSVLKRKP